MRKRYLYRVESIETGFGPYCVNGTGFSKIHSLITSDSERRPAPENDSFGYKAMRVIRDFRYNKMYTNHIWRFGCRSINGLVNWFGVRDLLELHLLKYCIARYEVLIMFNGNKQVLGEIKTDTRRIYNIKQILKEEDEKL